MEDYIHDTVSKFNKEMGKLESDNESSLNKSIKEIEDYD